MHCSASPDRRMRTAFQTKARASPGCWPRDLVDAPKRACSKFRWTDSPHRGACARTPRHPCASQRFGGYRAQAAKTPSLSQTLRSSASFDQRMRAQFPQRGERADRRIGSSASPQRHPRASRRAREGINQPSRQDAFSMADYAQLVVLWSADASKICGGLRAVTHRCRVSAGGRGGRAASGRPQPRHRRSLPGAGGNVRANELCLRRMEAPHKKGSMTPRATSERSPRCPMCVPRSADNNLHSATVALQNACYRWECHPAGQRGQPNVWIMSLPDTL